ncbi:TetR/AcrR family transcriptional regulator [Streptomyces sp. NPDC015171]|uniref:TetR/AcrR family transcriptional regulator n=1 Tax=Streptomyces sp. NPDC015171 TaxID=3364945 RepID=UPI0036FBA33C
MRTYGGLTAEQRVALRRQRLMDSAFELFSTQGYAHTSIRAVLRHSGLQDRYFAESFASLDHLMAAVIESMWDDQLARIGAGVGSGRPRDERAREAIRILVDNMMSDPRRGRLQLIEALVAGPATARVRQQGLKRMSGIVQSLLQASPADPPTDTLAKSIAVVGGMSQLLRSTIDGTLDLTQEALVDEGCFLFEAVANHIAPGTGGQY